MNESMVDNAAQEDDQFNDWKTVVRKKHLTWCHKTANSRDANIKTGNFWSTLKPGTRIVHRAGFTNWLCRLRLCYGPIDRYIGYVLLDVFSGPSPEFSSKGTKNQKGPHF